MAMLLRGMLRRLGDTSLQDTSKLVQAAMAEGLDMARRLGGLGGTLRVVMPGSGYWTLAHVSERRWAQIMKARGKTGSGKIPADYETVANQSVKGQGGRWMWVYKKEK